MDKIYAINIRKQAKETRQRKNELIDKIGDVDPKRQQKLLRKALLRDAKKSKINDIYPKNYEGHDHWHKFMTRDFYKYHIQRDKTIYECCQNNEADKKLRKFRNTSSYSMQELA